MASTKHEGLVSLFRNQPMLAPELLQGPLGVALPSWSEVRLAPSDFTQVVPTEYRADLVVLLKKGKPVFAIVVEVQLSRSSHKRNSWPVYLTSLRDRMKCPVVLLVVAPHQAVARWCARPISLGHPGFVLRPLVAGPSSIPVLQGKQAAGQSPELAVLSALAHGEDARLAPGLFEAVLSTARRLDTERSTFYVDLAYAAFGEAARSALEDLMRSNGYEYQSEFARRFIQQGQEQGQQEGRLEGERRALFKVLQARGLEVGTAARRRLMACTDLAQLERWLGRAVEAQSVQELFNPVLRSRPSARKAGSRSPNSKARKPRARR